MGTRLSVSIEDTLHPETSPRTDRPPTFDPMYGFSNGRKKREMIATWEEMDRWNLTIGQRDYCAHKLIELMRCKYENIPFGNYYCHDADHEYGRCHYEDHLLRIKEYEREKRLLKRMQRKKATQQAEEQ